MSRIREHLSPATVLAAIALFFAMAGGAYAVGSIPWNSVGANQLKQGAVTPAKLRNQAVTTGKIRNRAVTTDKIKNRNVTTDKIKNRAVTGAKIDMSTLGPVPEVEGHSTFARTRLVANHFPSLDTARENAAPQEMFKVGDVSIYAKCYSEKNEVTLSDETHAAIFIKTDVNGVIFESGEKSNSGLPAYLNSATAETDRYLVELSADKNSAQTALGREVTVMIPNGPTIEARLSAAVKNGTITAGDGIYGEGDSCLISGDLTEW